MKSGARPVKIAVPPPAFTPESLYIYRDSEGLLTFMGVPLESVVLMAGFLREHSLTSYKDVHSLVVKAEKAINGD